MLACPAICDNDDQREAHADPAWSVPGHFVDIDVGNSEDLRNSEDLAWSESPKDIRMYVQAQQQEARLFCVFLRGAAGQNGEFAKWILQNLKRNCVNNCTRVWKDVGGYVEEGENVY